MANCRLPRYVMARRSSESRNFRGPLMIGITRRRALLVTAGLGANVGDSANASSGISRMEAVDFERARISWTTKTGIDGHWRIAATACRDGSRDCIALAAAVIAGDVFGTGRLPRDPPYTYQLIATRKRHAILRAGDDFGNKDTEAANDTIFLALNIHAPQIAARRIRLEELTSTTFEQRWPLSVHLKVRGRTADFWILEFPVNHISTQNNPAQLFQIETGPVVIPQDLLDVPDASRIGECYLCYVFLNKAHQADLVAWGPSGSATAPRGFNHFARISIMEAHILSRL